MNLNELKAARDAEIKAAKALAEEHGEDMSEEVKLQVDKHVETASALAGEIEVEEGKRAAIVASLASVRDLETSPDNGVEVLKLRTAGLVPEKDAKRGFVDLGDFAAAVMNKAIGAGNDERLFFCVGPNQQKVGSLGGFLVPPEFSQEILRGMYDDADSLIANTRRLDGINGSITLNASAETSRTDGNRAGGIQGFWEDELATMTESNPKLRQVKIEPKTLTVFVKVTDKLLRNGGAAVGQWINGEAQDEINFKVGDAITNGDGNGKPEGFLQSGSLVVITKESGQAADSIVTANIDKMFARVPFKMRTGLVFFANQDAGPQLASLEDGNGNALMRKAFMLDGSEIEFIKGVRIQYTEYMQTLGDEGDVAFAHMPSYITAMGSDGVRSDSSIHLDFDKNRTAFRFLLDIDGQSKFLSATTPKNGSNDVSPFVTLAERT